MRTVKTLMELAWQDLHSFSGSRMQNADHADSRKTLLTLAVSVLPITSSPALQLGCIGVVIFLSLALYSVLLPYKTMRWNRTECSLLLTASLMTLLVTSLTLGLSSITCMHGFKYTLPQSHGRIL